MKSIQPIQSYSEFIRSKSQIDGMAGFEPEFLPDFLFPFQRHLVEWAVRKGRGAVFADCGLGKALRHDEPVLTPNGWKPISSLLPGDEVIGSNGDPCRVLGVYPQGVRELFAVRFTDGVEVICDAEHLWSVKTQCQRFSGRVGRTLATRQIIAEGLADGLNRKRHFVPLVRPVQYPEQEYPVDPYTLGVLLGDGSFRGLSLSLTTADPEIISYLVLPDGVEARLKSGADRAPSYTISVGKAGCGKGKTNPLTDQIKAMGLFGHASYDKFIPEMYLQGSIPQRRALLAGLLDTDGSVSDGTVEFISTSLKLSEGVAELVQSLGGVAPIRAKHPYYFYKGELKPGRTAYRVNVKLPSEENPFRLIRKRDAWEPRNRVEPPRAIASIRQVGDAPAVCIRVDSHDNLFVTRGHVLTHNTPMQLTWAENVVRKTNRPVLILTPLAVSVQTIREAEKFSIECRRSQDGKNIASGIYVTNYQRLHYFNRDDFAGVVCDESSIIKNADAATRSAVTEFTRAIPYRLLCTATAAPNDYWELGTSSEALGYLGFRDMITKFFKQETEKDYLGWGRTKYRFRGHSEQPFWRWVCSWARICRLPSDLGFSDENFVLPKLEENEIRIENSTPRPGYLFAVPANTLQEQRQELRVTLNERCERAAALIQSHKRPCVTWCHLNSEADLLEKLVSDSKQVSGSMSDERKEELLIAFQSGQLNRLLIKPRIGCLGLNWQHCSDVVMFPSYSWEQYYQAIRRCWRFGQKRKVSVSIITTEGQANVMDSLKRKTMQADKMFSNLTKYANAALHLDRTVYGDVSEKVPSWLTRSTNGSH